MKKFNFKIILPATLSILLFILTIFLVIIPRYQQSITNGKREMIKELTNAALSILSKYENDERAGLLTREEAQKTAISRIQYLRYGDENKDYFWITDMIPKMIVHPYRNDLNGKDLTDFTDPHGKRMFVEFVETVKKSDHGYVDYMWQWKVPITMFARTYSLQNQIRCSNTIERLTTLKEKNIINENTINEIVFAYNFLMTLRFRNQADLLDNKMPLSNSLNSRKLIDMELYLLKKILSAIPEYQNKIKIDFRIST